MPEPELLEGAVTTPLRGNPIRLQRRVVVGACLAIAMAGMVVSSGCRGPETVKVSEKDHQESCARQGRTCDELIEIFEVYRDWNERWNGRFLNHRNNFLVDSLKQVPCLRVSEIFRFGYALIVDPEHPMTASPLLERLGAPDDGGRAYDRSSALLTYRFAGGTELGIHVHDDGTLLRIDYRE